MDRRSAGIFLLGLWIFLSALPTLSYHIQRTRCRIAQSRYQDQISADEIVTIDLVSLDDVHWVVRGKEFLLNGHLFDVLEMHADPDHIHLICLADPTEDCVVKDYLARLAQKGTDKDLPGEIPLLIKQAGMKCILPEDQFTERIPDQSSLPSLASGILHCDAFTEVTTPPPEKLVHHTA